MLLLFPLFAGALALPTSSILQDELPVPKMLVDDLGRMCSDLGVSSRVREEFEFLLASGLLPAPLLLPLSQRHQQTPIRNQAALQRWAAQFLDDWRDGAGDQNIPQELWDRVWRVKGEQHAMRVSLMVRRGLVPVGLISDLLPLSLLDWVETRDILHPGQASPMKAEPLFPLWYLHLLVEPATNLLTSLADINRRFTVDAVLTLDQLKAYIRDNTNFKIQSRRTKVAVGKLQHDESL